jgi:uncharacterized membrane protein YfcA
MADPTTTPASDHGGPPPAAPTMPAPGRETTRARMVLDSVSGPVPALAAGWLAGLLLTSIQSPQLAVLAVIGLVGAFVAGLVGVGGAIILIPMLLYGPPLVGQPGLGIHAAAGVTMVQVAVSGAVAMLAHRRAGHLDPSVILTLGSAMASGSLVGGLSSELVDDVVLSAIFASLAALAAGMMLVSRRVVAADTAEGPVRYNRTVAVVLGVLVGTLVGMVGAGGGFLLAPIMVLTLRIPVRVAVGTTLAIAAISGVTGGIGKALAGQIDWFLALALVVGALPGAHLGARLSRRIPATALARLLGGLIALVAIKMWWDLVGR